MTYLLDTDTLTFMARGLKATGRGRRQKAMRERALRLVQRCRAAQESGDSVALSAITMSELEFGARKGRNYDAETAAVRKILLPFDRYDYDAVDCAHHYGRVRHALEMAGRPIGSMDMLIAAHALALGATLVTGNAAHFSRVDGLKIANW